MILKNSNLYFLPAFLTHSQVYYVYNDNLKQEGDIKKLFDEKYSKEADLKNITINNGLIENDIDERYNFKPIYAASSYIQGLDLTSIQNFEQTFFNDYSLLKQAFKRFKLRTSQGFKILKEVDQQFASLNFLKKSLTKTLEYINTNRSQIKKKFGDQYDNNQSIIKLYQEGIQELKKYEIHTALRKDGKQVLMDYYYDEAQMHKWRDSCVRSQESLKLKIDKFDKDFQTIRVKYSDQPQSSSSLDDQKCKELFKQIESFVSEKEPLIISIISTVYEELNEFHKNLNTFSKSDPQNEEIKQSQQFFLNMDAFKRKMKSHLELANQMEEHSKELDLFIADIKSLQFKNSLLVLNCSLSQSNARKEMKLNGATLEYIKYLSDYIARIEKDFNYLMHPQQLPRAYEKSLIEVQRRRKFRKLLDEEYCKLKKFIQTEKDKRALFINEFGRLLPSEFIPQLRDLTLSIRLEGGQKDYDLPDIDEGSGIDDFEEFKLFGNNKGAVSNNVSSSQDPEMANRFKEIQNELNLQKQEHQSNIKELNNKIQELEFSLKLKTDKISDFTKLMQSKEQDVLKMKQENEKIMKNLKDVSMTFSLTQKMNEETIARKTKEVETLLKEKKCRNCILCLEDLKDKQGDIVIQDLNERLMTKTKRIDYLEDQQRKTSSLINQVCSHNFQFLRQKTSDFYKSIDSLKQSYENRLMCVEENLSLETKRCETVIKTRVAALEERYLKSKAKESELNKKIKELLMQKDSTEKEIKTYQNKLKEYQQQLSKLNSENNKLLNDKRAIDEEARQVSEEKVRSAEERVRSLEEKVKSQEKNISSEKRRSEEAVKRESEKVQKVVEEKEREVKQMGKALESIQEEKTKLEEKVKRDSAILMKQLNELKESSEKEIRDKNENILRLNNLLNEHYDKSSESTFEQKVNKEQLEKKEKQLADRQKELLEVTSILSKRDKDILILKKENEKLQSELQSLQSQYKELERQIQSTKREVESQKSSSSQELERMKAYVKSMENEYQQTTMKSKENENMLQRIKELTCNQLNLQNYETWETSLTRALASNTLEQINFMKVEQGVRILFMPHSPGVYIALVLKNIEEIEQDYALKSKDLNASDSSYLMKSDSGPSVKRLTIKNNLFLDVESLSKNLQTILNSYQMIVIARIKGVTKHSATEDYNPFCLEQKETFFQIQIDKLEHFVGFEGDEFSFTDYACR